MALVVRRRPPPRPPSPAQLLAAAIKRRVPIETGNYPYVTARVRAKKAALLSPDVYARMLQMEVPQIARILSEGAYKAEILALAAKVSGVDLIEVATSRNMAAIFTQIHEFCEDELRRMIRWYLDRFDVQNLKTIVRGKTFGARPSEIREDLVPAGSLTEGFLDELTELATLGEVFERLDDTIYLEALEMLGWDPGKVERWNEWEDLVTKLYYRNLLNAIPERTTGTRLMREWVRREVDVVNLKTLLRLWAARVTLPYEPFIGDGWEIPAGRLEDMLALDAAPLSAQLREYRVAEGIADRVPDLKEVGVGSLIRSVEKTHLLLAGREAHVHPLSVLPILDYIVRKEREVQNLRIIARGKESGLSADVIRELLVV